MWPFSKHTYEENLIFVSVHIRERDHTVLTWSLVSQVGLKLVM